MGFSHRDHRTYRTIRRGVGAVVASVGALIAIAVLLPGEWIGLTAVAALGAVGALYAWHAHRLVSSYLTDLEKVRTGQPMASPVRLEAAGDIGLERRTVGPLTRSPNARRPAVDSGTRARPDGHRPD